ncbi:MAG: carboxypeptidase regulatory-like domain-containing protein [Elusimicrobia bacterium]|nr:carboxypeptidase regulatory-like domain-containing protein [Elusimicrobiota bacterium]
MDYKMKRSGLTLVELMIVSAIISIGLLGIVGSFKYFNWGIQAAKGKSLANNLAQEKIEVLKNKSYYRILVTSATAEDTNFSPSITYDTHPNGTETLNVGGMEFKRMVYIRKISENASGDISYYDWDAPDTGMKEILVYVIWRENNTWKKVELRNLRDNPNRTNVSATFAGNVEEEGTSINLSSVTVRCQENPSRYDETDASGDYSFYIEPGSYTLRASKTGYFANTSTSVLSISANQTLGQNFTLRKMSTGTIIGSVFLRDHLVISQVVGSSVNADDFYQEWVEVFNPTTWTWTMATGLNSGVIGLVYQLRNQPSPSIIDVDYLTLTLEPQHYYLFANTNTITAVGVTRDADAVYDPTMAGYPNIIKINTDSGNDAAGVGLGWYATMTGMDAVGWKTGGQSPEMKEGTPIQQDTGLQNDESYTRRYNPGAGASGFGRAYDSNDNNTDFLVRLPIYYQPHNSSDIETVRSGTPASGTVVFADDGLSTPVIADSSGNFTLTNVATGYWTVYASSSVCFSSAGIFGGTSNGFSASADNLFLTSATVYGYISGRVTNALNNPLSGIVIYGGGLQTTTDGVGGYLLSVLPDTITVIANYLTANPAYVETSSMNVVVNLGQITKNVDLILVQGGNIRGWVTTTTGVDPLPNIPITASKSGTALGAGISGSDGYFSILNLSTGTYAVATQLEAGESAVPSSFTAVISAGSNLFVGTFTVSGAMGYISGTVTSAGTPITTGILLYATTTTITGNPPAIDSALRSGSNIYYGISSDAEGNFTLPVRGGYTYNLYGWHTTWSGETPYTAPKSTTSITVPAGQTVNRSLSW